MAEQSTTHHKTPPKVPPKPSKKVTGKVEGLVKLFQDMISSNNEVKPSAGKQVIEHKTVHTPQHAQVSDPPKPQKAQISDPQKKVPPPVPPKPPKEKELSPKMQELSNKVKDKIRSPIPLSLSPTTSAKKSSPNEVITKNSHKRVPATPNPVILNRSSNAKEQENVETTVPNFKAAQKILQEKLQMRSPVPLSLSPTTSAKKSSPNEAMAKNSQVKDKDIVKQEASNRDNNPSTQLIDVTLEQKPNTGKSL